MARKISRREFLGDLSKLGLGVIAAPGLLPLLNNNALGAYAKQSSLVVKVTDSNATVGFSSIDTDVLQIMMDVGIKTFTGITNLGEAWKSLFPGISATSSISLKVNCIYSTGLSSHREVANAIVNGLTQMNVGGSNFPANNIIIWDRTNSELTGAGYSLNTGSTGVRCFGTNQSGVGYDPGATAVIDGTTVQFSRILSQLTDYLIDVPVVKDHGSAGVTFSMKNFYGAINNQPHNDYCNYGIAELNNTNLVKQKTKIVVCDALWGIYNGGPSSGWTYNAFTPNSLYFATDRVAVDYILLQLVDTERASHGYLPRAPYAKHIQTANDLGVGTNNPAEINVVEITNPSQTRVVNWAQYG